MGKPRMIILIRHAQSEGNKNRDIHQAIPDHRVKLTSEGWTQAYDAGRKLRSLLRADDTLHFFTSPYRRTRETTEGILATLTSDEPSPSPFPRQSIKVYEEPRLREQDFGNFQPCSAEMERMWQERADYGHFFYRIPNGESAADAYDRVSGFNESLWRQFGEDDCASVCVLVTHGLMSRIFLMKWYHFSVEYFEDLRNVNHCEFLVMRKKEDSGKYILENNLRTWSQLKRDRMAAAASKALPTINTSQSSLILSDREKEKEKRLAPGVTPTESRVSSPVPMRKKWGGCPNGCDHSKNQSYKKVNSMHAMSTSTKGVSPVTAHLDSLPFRRPPARRWQSSSEEDEDDPRGRIAHPSPVDIQRSLDEIVSSPDGTPSFISIEDRMRAHAKSPRNANGNGNINDSLLLKGMRGNASLAVGGSDTEFSAEEEKMRKGIGKRKAIGGAGLGSVIGTRRGGKEEGAMCKGSMADPLGDQSDAGSDTGDDEREVDAQDATLTTLEREEKSVRGSVY